jgi:hypothetical protein
MNERFKDLAESFSCFLAGNTNTKRYDFIIAVDSRENSYCILSLLRAKFLNEIVSEVIAHYLTIGMKVLFHLWTHSNDD